MKHILILFISFLSACNTDHTPVKNIPSAAMTAIEYEANDCYSEELHNYDIYDSAVQDVEQTKRFKVKMKIENLNSSWIQKATYCSCDSITGYFILMTREGKKYLHEGLPYSEWSGFMNADSYGEYYDRHIKGKYRFELTKKKDNTNH
jgi:KTSC domain